ncbi:MULTISPECIES: NOP5/NOP56 family protein [Haloferacaceae]|uniref:NOP5/NOP56 family protein n=1 Tax=Halorubrum glutamatedens TaxID=2707018 RepID=A0ABD5QUX9_9EURY|nr:nucleolar [Halobellus captivus]
MTDADADSGWFESVPPDDLEAARKAIDSGNTESPKDWPTKAVESGFAEDKNEYYDKLHEAATYTTREVVKERERADDQQLKHSIRAMDDCERVANELAERATEWAGSRFDDVDTGIAGARDLAEREPSGDLDGRVVSLSARAAALADERDALAATIDRIAPAVAPNLADMAGPELAARLIALAGGLEPLAKKPSGTVQVLGAEDALFAHLSGRAPSPKHGIIYTHEFVRGTRPEDRGSAARALAGKLALAARADHYSGEYREVLHEDLRERMATIRARAEPAGVDGDADDAPGPGGDSAATEGDDA